MLSPSPPPASRNGLPTARKTFGSLEKKRARDRRAQQRQRDKRNEQIHALEQQVQHLLRTCDGLQRENMLLRARQDCLSDFIRTWDSGSLVQEVPPTRTAFGTPPDPVSVPAATQLLPPSPIYLTPNEAAQQLPQWAQIPRYILGNISTEVHTLWLQVDPAIVAEAPENPSPLDLLFGSKQNRMADHIHNSTRYWKCRDSERLACGWLLYVAARWILQPSESAFASLPVFLRPVPEQLSHSHLSCIDGFFYPEIRRNLILKQSQYDFVKVVGLFACCLKVRWPWGKNMLMPGENGDLYVRPDFYETFMSIDGWGITDEFIQAYPDLLEGLDTDSIRYLVQ